MSPLRSQGGGQRLTMGTLSGAVLRDLNPMKRKRKTESEREGSGSRKERHLCGCYYHFLLIKVYMTYDL